MGSSSSKFKKHVQNGDEFAAMQIFQSTPELRKSLDPNLSYGDSHHHNTALHYAAKHSMKHLLRTFLNDLGGNPNKKNSYNETSLHCACQLSQKTYSAEERRLACVSLLLQWRGITLNSGEKERMDLVAQDQKGNTALHYAALSGLEQCVELLLANGAPLFVENNDKLTPCDVAVKNQHHEIAQLLESRMVFADNNDIINEADLYSSEEQDEVYSGLRTQDLQEAKDQLLVETSDMLHIPLFTAEALLRDNEWSRETLLEKWMKDPVQCCQLAGVQPPESALQKINSEQTVFDAVCNSPQNGNLTKNGAGAICEICTSVMPCWNQSLLMSCDHRFCKSCWKRYLTVKIQEGDAHHILCPAFECPILVPVDVIEKLVSPDMARRYLQFDIKAFVESNRYIKWCPKPGCGRAVRLPETEQMQPSDVYQNVPYVKLPPNTSHAVDCGNGHFFCWECLDDAHAPCGCVQWLEWQQKISEIKPEELKTSCLETENAANCLWLVTNSKPCPNCKSPIQKNEGCNHMKCSKCKFDFCWVCLENWKKHSSATGGYFRCNRFEAVHKADEKQGVLINEATVKNQQMQELNRFLHYYTRFRNHENSQKLEEPLLNNARQKMEILASSLEKSGRGEECMDKSTRFVEDGIRELLKARRILCGSYVYGFYLEDSGCNRTIFEFMQNELEEVTEKLSEMVARPYLRTPRSVIIQTTILARRKRHEFVRAVSKGLVPPETPPTVCNARSRRLRGLLGLDETNDETDVNHALAVSLLDECNRLGCARSRTQSQQAPVFHEYCNLKCTHSGALGNATDDYNVDLVIALEMSRLQLIEDEMKKRQIVIEESRENRNMADSNDVGAGSSQGTGGDHEANLAASFSLPGLSSKNEHSVLEYMQTDNVKGNVNYYMKSDGSKINNESDEISSKNFLKRTNADLTVDYFLKSLAGQQMDFKNFSYKNIFSPDDKSDSDMTWDSGASKSAIDKALLSYSFKPCNAEDGRFEIGDIHENGCFNNVDTYSDAESNVLKRSHSTGDLCTGGRGHRRRGGTPGSEDSRYHLDSDHSSQHDEKPEDIVKRILAFPASGKIITDHHSFLLHHHSAGGATSAGGETSTTNSEDGTSIYFGNQSSVEDTNTTTSDSLNADLEVCDILGTTTENSDADIKVYEENDTSLSNQFGKPIHSTLKCTHFSGDNISHKKKSPVLHDNKNEVFSGNVFEKDILDGCKSDKRSPEAPVPSSSSATYHETVNSECKKPCNAGRLRIQVFSSSQTSNSCVQNTHILETDSSNEYESETGIPKSPTLFISGVSICRTPEPCSPGLTTVITNSSGRTSRSSSLTVPVISASGVPSSSLDSLNASFNTTSLGCSTVPESPTSISSSCTKLARNFTFTPPPLSLIYPSSSPVGIHSPCSTVPSPILSPNSFNITGPFCQAKSKSASEPEREREMFCFPKSSTDGALSSVLHVQESNLSSDDFHEALFLLEHSPKGNVLSKKRKKTKKDYHKDKETSNGICSSGRVKEAKEASSAL